MGNPNHDPKTGEFSSGGGGGGGRRDHLGQTKRLPQPKYGGTRAEHNEMVLRNAEREAAYHEAYSTVPTTHVHHEPGSDAMKRQLAHQADEASIARTMAKEAAMGPRKPGERAPTLEEHRQMLQNYKNRRNLPPHRQ